jgi:hypothetical protein
MLAASRDGRQNLSDIDLSNDNESHQGESDTEDEEVASLAACSTQDGTPIRDTE